MMGAHSRWTGPIDGPAGSGSVNGVGTRRVAGLDHKADGQQITLDQLVAQVLGCRLMISAPGDTDQALVPFSREAPGKHPTGPGMGS